MIGSFFCPRCGTKVEDVPVIVNLEVNDQYIHVTYKVGNVKHSCPNPNEDKTPPDYDGDPYGGMM